MVDFTSPETAATWALHTLAGGAVLFGGGWAALRSTADPARRHALGVWLVRGGLLVAVLSLLPAWLVLPVLPRTATQLAEDVAHTDIAAAGPEIDRETSDDATAEHTTMEMDWSANGAPLRVEVVTDENSLPLGAPRSEVPTADGLSVESLLMPVLTPPPPPSVEPTPSLWPGIARVLLLAYGVGIALTALPLLAGGIALIRLRNRGQSAPATVQALFDELVRGMRSRPRLVIVERLASPVCLGLFRPLVLLPRTLARCATDVELRWIFAHELSHIRRGDLWTGWLVALARVFYFVVPWFWPVRRELMLSQEYLADAAAAAAAGTVDEYAAFLVRLSSAPGGRRHPVGAAAVRAARSDLFRRVSMLLVSNTAQRRAPRWWTAAAAAGAIGTAVVLSGIGFAQERGDARPQPAERGAEQRRDPRPGDEPKPRIERAIEQARPAAAVPPEIAALRKAIDEAEKRGADVTEIRKQLDLLEKSMTARRVVVVEPVPPPAGGLRVGPAGPQPNPRLVPGANARPEPALAKEIAELRERAADLKAQGKLREAEELLAKAEALTRKFAEENRRIVVAPQPPVGPAGPVWAQGGVVYSAGSGMTIEPRLGIQVDAIPPALGVQLDLPKGQGVVVSAMFKDFPGDRAGLKTGDILLVFNDKPVSENPAEFLRMVAAVKPGETADIVIMRKGKKETLKGIVVPEAKRGAGLPVGRGDIEVEIAPVRPAGPPVLVPVRPGPPIAPVPPGGVRPGAAPVPPAGGGGARSSSIQVEVQRGNFKILAEDDGVKYEILGTIADGGKPDPTRIEITDGTKKLEATSLEKVPGEYRDRVVKLLENVRARR